MEKFTIYIGIIIITILELTYVFSQDNLAPLGKELLGIREKTEYYHRQNLQLNDQYLALTSYQTISAKAHARGFVPATYIYLK